VYEWRRGPRADATRPLPLNAIVVIVETLCGAVETAAQAYRQLVLQNAELESRLKAHLPALLCYEPHDPT